MTHTRRGAWVFRTWQLGSGRGSRLSCVQGPDRLGEGDERAVPPRPIAGIRHPAAATGKPAGTSDTRRGLDRNDLPSRADGTAQLDCPARTVCAGTLAGTDPRDGIGGQGGEREALVIDLHAAAGSVEVQIVEAARPAMGRQVRDVDGFNVEEEARLRLRRVAR